MLNSKVERYACIKLAAHDSLCEWNPNLECTMKHALGFGLLPNVKPNQAGLSGGKASSKKGPLFATRN